MSLNHSSRTWARSKNEAGERQSYHRHRCHQVLVNLTYVKLCQRKSRWVNLKENCCFCLMTKFMQFHMIQAKWNIQLLVACWVAGWRKKIPLYFFAIRHRSFTFRFIPLIFFHLGEMFCFFTRLLCNLCKFLWLLFVHTLRCRHSSHILLLNRQHSFSISMMKSFVGNENMCFISPMRRRAMLWAKRNDKARILSWFLRRHVHHRFSNKMSHFTSVWCEYRHINFVSLFLWGWISTHRRTININNIQHFIEHFRFTDVYFHLENSIFSISSWTNNGHFRWKKRHKMFVPSPLSSQFLDTETTCNQRKLFEWQLQRLKTCPEGRFISSFQVSTWVVCRIISKLFGRSTNLSWNINFLYWHGSCDVRQSTHIFLMSSIHDINSVQIKCCRFAFALESQQLQNNLHFTWRATTSSAIINIAIEILIITKKPKTCFRIFDGTFIFNFFFLLPSVSLFVFCFIIDGWMPNWWFHCFNLWENASLPAIDTCSSFRVKARVWVRQKFEASSSLAYNLFIPSTHHISFHRAERWKSKATSFFPSVSACFSFLCHAL